ncbi:hypothetical protein [Microbulbifer epialgicus]|uniref:Uncharacterized protein n=1 Tax=Microbulbifer epialgicus TaxID=393907 RepID=A0ABV4NZ77_9GAMM
MHRAIYALARLSHRALRFASLAFAAAEQRLVVRNQEVLLAAGKEAAERRIERELERIEATMRRELSQYPTLHRRLCEQLAALDEDYVHSAEVPPEPSNWARAIRSVSEIPAQDDSVVADVLDTINHSMRKAESRALESYRESTRERHQLLKRMMPSWRAMLKTLGRINKNVESVIRRAKALDGHIERYEEIVQESDRGLRTLTASSFNRFLASSVFLLVVSAGILVNFQLIARPVSEIVGGNILLGNFFTADIFAFVLIFLQVGIGLVVMECLGITRLFPSIDALTDSTRRSLKWSAVILLLLFAGVEASLAFSRELLFERDQLLAGVAEGITGGLGETELHWTLLLAQMGLGFTLPLVLAFSAIPLEQFISSARTVLGMFLVFTLRLLATLLRLLALVSLHSGVILNRIYDLVVFLPLWLYKLYLRRQQDQKRAGTGREGQPAGINGKVGEGLPAEQAGNV